MVNLSMAIALPLYIWPTTGAWKPLFNAITSSPNSNFNIIINPDSGPGDGISEPEIISNVAKLNNYSNVNLFGYVHVSYGKRNILLVETDIRTYANWSTYKSADIHLDGIFLDEAPYDLGMLPYMANVSSYIKKQMPKHHFTWTNPGIPIDEAFYDHADLVNAYENTYADWSRNGGNSSVPACLRQKSTVMLYNYTAGNTQLSADAKALTKAGYNASFVTSANGYEEFGADWAAFVADVAKWRSTKVDALPASCEEC